MKIYTVGYEGLDIDQFLEILQKNKITRLLDIRKNPVSRKKGFSKNKLRENLQTVDIEYQHFGGLGVPSAWRKSEKAHLITRKKMFSDYVKEVLPAHEKEIEEVIASAKSTKRAVLLCFEADASDCHRHFLAEELKDKANFQVVDIKLPVFEKTLMPRKKSK